MNFAGVGAGAYVYFLERSTPPDPARLDAWKELEREGWDITAVVKDDGSTMVGFGIRYLEAGDE